MAPTSRHWWSLIIGVSILIAAAFVLPRLPGVAKPELAENRVLAQAPRFEASIDGLDAFRRGVDAWVADQFPPRTHLIGGLNALRYRLGYSGTPRVVVGRDGWLFYDDGTHLGQVRPSTLSASDVDAWVEVLRARVASLERRGIDYLLVVPPVKERVYPDLLPAWAATTREAAVAAGDAARLVEAAGVAGLAVVPDLHGPLALAAAQGMPAYTPFDTHWSGEGAYIAYREILRALAARGHDLEPRPRQAFERREVPPLSQPQDLAYMLGIASSIRQDYVELHDPSHEARRRVTWLGDGRDWTSERVIDTGAEGPVLLFIGDSFSTALLPLLEGHFRQVVFAHHQDGFHREDLVGRYSPDIVVLEVLESGARHAMGGSPAAAEPAPGSWRQVAALVDADAAIARGEATYRCSIDRAEIVGDGAGARLAGSGWFADVERDRPVGDAMLVVDGEGGAWAHALAITSDRPDVAAYFGQPALLRSGFVFELPLPPGGGVLQVRLQEGERRLTCLTRSRLTLPAREDYR